MVPTIITSAITIFFYMIFLFLMALRLKNNSIVDVGWGLGFLLLAVFLFLRHPVMDARKLLLGLWVAVWSLRLSAHVYARNRGRAEDSRYAAMRKNWGRFVIVKSFFFVFMLQGMFMLIVSLPIQTVLASEAAPLSAWDGIGSAVFVFGFLFETIGDLQLSRFIRKPENRGKLMTEGLWARTRHPNYFGEAALWWGLWLMAVPLENGWIAVAGPLTITLLLRFVSGVPLLEKRLAGRKDFEAYKKRTPAFFPFPSRKTSSSPG